MNLRSYKLSELAEIVGGDVDGDDTTLIRGVAGIREAEVGDITFLADARYEKFLQTTRASALISSRETRCSLPVIRVGEPYVAFAQILGVFATDREPAFPSGIHETAIIDPSAKLGDGVSIGPYCQIGRSVRIGDNSRVVFGTYIGDNVSVGRDCVVYPNVTIRERSQIGDRVIVHPGVVIGADGFGFAKDGETYRKIPQIGTVVVEDDVEIGANATIDRATTGATRICQGVKIDNLVMIAHNVLVGSNTVLAGQVGISGSTRLGRGVVMAGQVGLVGHIDIGDGVVMGAKSGVTKSIPDGMTIAGYPAREHHLWKRLQAHISNLPDMHKKLLELNRRVDELEKGKNHDQTTEDDR